MQKFKTFLNSFVKSLTQPSYYNDIRKAPFGFSMKYFTVFNFFIALIVTTIISVPVATFDLQKAITTASTIYPEELQIEVMDGELSINQELPYVVSIDESFLKDFGVDERIDDFNIDLVTFTSDQEFIGVGNFANYKSFAVITESTVYVIDDMETGEVRAYPISQAQQDMVIDADMVAVFTDNLKNMSFIKNKVYVPTISSIVFVAAFIGTLIVRSVTLLIFSLLAWLTAMLAMKDKQLSFGEVYQLSIHSITLVILVSWAVSFSGVFELSGLWYFLVYMVWSLFIFNQLEEPKAAAASKVVKKKTSPKTKKKAKK